MPEDPIKCSSENTQCTITNSYGTFPDRSICGAERVFYPRNEEEVVEVVAKASESKRKLKVATRYSHSIPKWVCPDGQKGWLISTKYLNRVLEVDAVERTITVQSGVTLKQLINESARAGLALPYAPYWWGLTIGGILGTGAHGSSLWGNGSAVHERVLELTIVTPATPQHGHAMLHRLSQHHHHLQHLHAAQLSLGLLGITLKLEPLFKRSITYLTQNDSDLGDQAVTFGQQHEFADIIWYPNQHKAVYRVDDRVPMNTSGSGVYDFIPFRSTPSLELALIRTTEDVQESVSDSEGKCLLAKTATNTLMATAYGLTNDGVIFSGFPVVGFHNHLQASGSCLDNDMNSKITSCPGTSGLKGIELEPKGFCGIEIYNGILMRYVKPSSAYLGKQEDAIDFDITYYRSKDPMTPRLHEDIIEEIEQMGIFKYGGLPHWGKNRNVAFEGVIDKYKNAWKFLKVKDEYDPQGLFSSEWTDQVLGLKEGITKWKDGCALEEELQEATRDANGKCAGAMLLTATLAGIGYALTNNVFFLCTLIIRMQASGRCLDSLNDGLLTECPWDSRVKGVFFHQTTFSISLSKVKNFIEDVQKLVELEPKALCGVVASNGIPMLYVTASSVYLGKSEDAVHADFDITYYPSKDPYWLLEFSKTYSKR
ncbi:hypothetical protein Fmac_007235 [Flemingia macrophylla]|uniref:L-gulonolactone oxidase n=1 Tax=Flemingia macrophylla TaxID=520843 RepID=A0ABD1NFN0_9FABA